MSLKKFKATSPGQRHKLISDYSEITSSSPEKSLTKGSGKSGGRNNTGKMTMRYIGGGHKKRYRILISKEISTIFLQKFTQLNMIQIELLELHFYIMPTVKRDI